MILWLAGKLSKEHIEMSKVYHYTKLTTAIEYILPRMELRTNNLHRMNDPKENQPWSFAGRNIDYQASYPDTYSHTTHIDHQYKLGDEIKGSCQILCFVKDNPLNGYLNEIMWAHYADNHKGVCLEIDVEIFLNDNAENMGDHRFEEVLYGGHDRLFFSWDRELTKEQNIDRFVKARYKDLFLKKSTYWERENEQRLVIFGGSQKYLSIKNSLTGLYFGLQIPNSYRPSIDSLIDEKQTTLFNLYYEGNTIKAMQTMKGDSRPFIIRKYVN